MTQSRFMSVFADLPIPLRREIISVIDGQPMSWNVAYTEIKNKTKLGDKILAQLNRLEII